MEGLRAAFPVLERLSYLNAGTNGPVPRPAVEAVEREVTAQAEQGRGDPAFSRERVAAFAEVLRARAAGLLGCEPGEVALTGSATDGINAIVSALDLGPGDEVLTSDEEHPGLLAPLAAGRARRGFEVRVAPFAGLERALSPRTRLVAASHVSWVTGQVLDTEPLAAAEAPLLLDGAQGLGAIPVDVRALGCDFYAAAGQKWLCGPNGVGYLFVRRELVRELLPAWAGYSSLADVNRPLELVLHDDARRFDMALPPSHHSAWALAALDVLERPGLQAVHDRARALAARLADDLARRGRRVAHRGASTLVSWESDDPAAEAARLRSEGIVLRDIPGRSYVRASVGAWTSEAELERLVAATSAS